MSEVISPEEWEEWRGNPTIHKVKNLIRQERQEMLEITGGGFQLNNSDNTYELTRRVSKSVGYIEALDWLLELDKPAEKGKEDGKV